MEKIDIVDSIYSYVVDGLTLEKIGNKYSLTAREISNILEPYGITGRRNAERVNGFYGYNLGIFKNGYIVETSGNGYNEGDAISVTRKKIKDFVYHKGENQTLENFLQYGPPKAKFKSVGKITASVVVSIITVSIINPFSLFEIGTTENSSVVSDFFIELKDDIIDIAKDTFIAKIIYKTNDKIDDYKINKISEGNAQVINDLNHQAINGEPGYFMLDGVKYIGFINDDKPVGECFGIDKNSNSISVGTYIDGIKGINNKGLKTKDNFIEIGTFSNDILIDGLLLEKKASEIIEIVQIRQGATSNIDDDVSKILFNISTGKSDLLDIEGNIINNYIEGNYTSLASTNYLVVEDWKIEIGLFSIKNNKILYKDDEVFMSVDIDSNDVEYNSLVLYEYFKREGEEKAADSITGCKLEFNTQSNRIEYTYLTEKMEHHYTKNLNY